MSVIRFFTARTHGRRAQWWISFGLFTLLMGAWAVAQPYNAGPDELSHAMRAYSVAHGELLGPTRAGFRDNVRFVETPQRFVSGSTASSCFAFNPNVSAACAPNLRSFPGDTVRAPLSNGRYPPTPYGAVGLPTAFGVDSAIGLYLMRLAGAAICAGLFASALLSLRQTRHRWLAVSGLAFALTPMVFFVASVVNPSNLEIAGGVAFWSSAVVLAGHARAGVVDGRAAARAACAAGVLILARPLGMIWLGLAAVIVAFTCTQPAVRLLLRSRAVQLAGAAVAVCAAFELMWILLTDTLASKTPPGPSAEGMSNLEVLLETFGLVPRTYREMIGVFGWTDTPVPSVTLILWTVAVGLLVLLALGLTSRRFACLVAATLAVAIVAQALLEAIEAREFGFGWQGRYTLPFAVGLPILAGYALARERRTLPEPRRLAALLAGTFVIGHFLAYAQNLRRYAVGARGSLFFWRDAEWSAPLPSSFLLVAYFLVLIVVAFWLWSSAADPDRHPERELLHQ